MPRYLPLVFFLLLAALCALPLLRGADPSAAPSVLVGRKAPPAPLPGFGKKPVLVNFFASWCLSCAGEQGVLARIAKDGIAVYGKDGIAVYGKDGIAVYGINYKDQADKMTPWLKTHGNPYKAVGIDADGHVGIDWGITGVPETFIVDGAGVVRYRFAGPVTEEVYTREIQPLLRELKP
jgi:cytochrome c biogenesis protein CcmG/thiol:disulfide interchange protein DsbE